MGTAFVVTDHQAHARSLLPAELVGATHGIPGSDFAARSVAGGSNAPAYLARSGAA
jgi:hypothetical protein